MSVTSGQINLKGVPFRQEVPDDLPLQIVVKWKGKGYNDEVINPVQSFALEDGELKVVNRNNPDNWYAFKVSQVKTATISLM